MTGLLSREQDRRLMGVGEADQRKGGLKNEIVVCKPGFLGPGGKVKTFLVRHKPLGDPK